MASPQAENGHVDIANEIVEALARIRLSGEEMQVLWVIFRKTYGWHKKTDLISYGQFSECTGLSRQHVLRAVKKLLPKMVIRVTKNGDSGINLYEFNKDFDQWQVLPKKVTVTKKGNKGVTKKGSRVLPKKGHTKESITKEKNTKEKHEVELPQGIFQESWTAFLEMRKKIKHPLTDRAIKLIVKELQKLEGMGFEMNAVLDQSTRNDWRDVYGLKENKQTESERRWKY